MRRPALLLLPVLIAGSLTACGGGGGGSQSDLPKVSGAYGSKPKVTVAKDSAPGKTLDTELLKKGDGPKVVKGDLLVADYLGKIYKSGKVFDNSYDRNQPAAFPIGTGGVVPGWDKALVGVRAGSRVLMVLPPKEGYGKAGNKQAGIKGTDTLVFVVDVIASYAKTGATAKSTPVADLPADLPTVTGDAGTKPTISVPADATPPKKPVVTVLATGTGPDLAQGMLAVIDFTAVKWSGDALRSSFDPDPSTGQPTGPQAVPIGAQQGSPFDLLVGVPSGSRVLLTLPAQTGADPATDSIAVVVDLLGAHGSAKETTP